MSDTPRTDAHMLGGSYSFDGEFARQLERELNAAKAALSGRTVSCSNCNAMAEELAELKKALNNL